MNPPVNKAAKVLVDRAKELLETALLCLDEYNEVAEALEELGYREVVALFDNVELFPPPPLGLSSGNANYDDTKFLDEILKTGPIGKPDTGASGRKFSLAAERGRLGGESGWKCFYCGEQGESQKGPDGRNWHVDHAYPVSRGGDNEQDNLVLACATCNLEKKALSAAEYFKKKSAAQATCGVA